MSIKIDIYSILLVMSIIALATMFILVSIYGSEYKNYCTPANAMQPLCTSLTKI